MARTLLVIFGLVGLLSITVRDPAAEPPVRAAESVAPMPRVVGEPGVVVRGPPSFDLPLPPSVRARWSSTTGDVYGEDAPCVLAVPSLGGPDLLSVRLCATREELEFLGVVPADRRWDSLPRVQAADGTPVWSPPRSG